MMYNGKYENRSNLRYNANNREISYGNILYSYDKQEFIALTRELTMYN